MDEPLGKDILLIKVIRIYSNIIKSNSKASNLKRLLNFKRYNS